MSLAEPSTPSRAAVFLASAAALFVQLLLIRWIGSEVRIFAYFQNLTLIACLLGFGLGMFCAHRRDRLLTSVVALEVLLFVVALAGREGWAWGPAVVSSTFSRAVESITMGDEASRHVGAGEVAVAWGWTAGLFLGAVAAMFGYAQRIAAGIAAFAPERRLAAYGWNLAGSLVGVLSFALAGALWLPPWAWLALGVLATLPLLAGRARFLVAVSALPVMLLLQDARVTWSPYQKLEHEPRTGAVIVNGTGYMVLRGFEPSPNDGDMERRGLDRWRLPHTVHPGAGRVLIVGAGGGNDVAAALRAGATRVVAVEIDAAILAIGDHHPERPYADPRVVAVVDDARHHIETTDEQFDLIVFSHLDAHGALSAFTNVRLDNYVHTVESFRAFRRRLAPGGALYVSFQAIQPWVAERLRENLALAFDAPPVTWLARSTGGQVLSHFLATDDAALRARADAFARDVYTDERLAPAPAPSSDAWPYLYVLERAVPRPMLWVAVPLVLLTVLLVGLVVRRDAGAALPLDRHFACLGAAFLLVEVHNVSRLALVFGTTWSVNAWVISGVLAVALGATALAARLAPGPPRWAYAPLIALLLVGAATPLGALVGLPGGALLAVLLFSAPLAFAGLLFGGSLRVAPDPARALGANVLGALLGGFLELGSFLVGLPGLLVLAAALYALSWPTRSSDERAAASSGPAAP